MGGRQFSAKMEACLGAVFEGDRSHLDWTSGL